MLLHPIIYLEFRGTRREKIVYNTEYCCLLAKRAAITCTVRGVDELLRVKSPFTINFSK